MRTQSTKFQITAVTGLLINHAWSSVSRQTARTFDSWSNSDDPVYPADPVQWDTTALQRNPEYVTLIIPQVFFFSFLFDRCWFCFMAAAFCAAVELYRSLFIYVHSLAHLLGTPAKYNAVQCNNPVIVVMYTKVSFEWCVCQYGIGLAVFVLDMCVICVVYREVFTFFVCLMYNHCNKKDKQTKIWHLARRSEQMHQIDLNYTSIHSNNKWFSTHTVRQTFHVRTLH